MEGGDDIPFEDDSLPPAIDHEPAPKTTITGSERAAFEKLYRTVNSQGKAGDRNSHDVELDQIVDEYYEDDEDPSQSLDKVFDEVLKGESKLRTHGQRPTSRTVQPEPGTPPGKSTKSRSGAGKLGSSRKQDSEGDVAQLKQLKLAERERVDTLIHHARTDHHLWQILEREVFDQITKLDLDGTNEQRPKSQRKTTQKNTTTADPRILFQNYPHHLIIAVQTLRREFPSSPLPLSLLPKIKSLGRSSYALGATTTLYAHLIRTAWIQQSSYTHVATFLTDMNNGAIEFNDDILALLEAIIKENEMARSGRMGKEMQMVYGMEQFREGIDKIKQWRGVVAERLGVATPTRKPTATVLSQAYSDSRRVQSR